jgi:hypothetical protein
MRKLYIKESCRSPEEWREPDTHNDPADQWRVARLWMTIMCATYAEGAPSLRLLQGRVAMLPRHRLIGMWVAEFLNVVVPSLRDLIVFLGGLPRTCVLG